MSNLLVDAVLDIGIDPDLKFTLMILAHHVKKEDGVGGTLTLIDIAKMTGKGVELCRIHMTILRDKGYIVKTEVGWDLVPAMLINHQQEW